MGESRQETMYGRVFHPKKGPPKKPSFVEAKEKCGDCELLVEDGNQWWCDDMNCWITRISDCRHWDDDKRR